MECNVYAILDSKSRCFSMPFYCINDEVAARSFSQLANDPATEIGRHAGDFTLYRIGTFDNNSAAFHNESPVVSLGLAASYKEVIHASQS